MKISELFRRLSYGELSNLSISDSGSGEINVKKVPQVIQYTNDGLSALYGRFVLSEKELIVEQVDHVTQYRMLLKHTESVGAQGEHHYIKDELEPFKDDMIRIVQVYDENGRKYPLNDEQNPDSLFLPKPDTVQVPSPAAGVIMSVVYQAKPPKLVDASDDDNVLDQEFEIPHVLENALIQYIAHKVFFHIGGQENVVKSQGYLSTYEANCLDVEQRDLVNQSFHTSHSKLEQRGFV